MSQTLAIEVRDEVFAAIERQAQASGVSPAAIAVSTLESQFGLVKPPLFAADLQAARARFARHFGAVAVADPTSADNESIDADLGRAFSDNHEAN